ncbi:phosphoribosylformylglycinamidine synthase subunit PurQ [candidate division KSB1 bacterium]|nr:MAG: phosphoribosylformylglycinamidine synthase subunit PurQ [candidate division KSB1 bacterium]
MVKPKVLIITGYGFNCEKETEFAFRLAGGEPEQVHLNDLLLGEKSMDEYHIMAFVGGFSFGDHISAGKVVANKFKYNLEKSLQKFISDGKLIIGICNGFQVMTKLGILPGLNGDYRNQKVTLTMNDSGHYEDRWVHLTVNKKSNCVFTRGIDMMYLPVRHGEGKFYTEDEDVILSLFRNNQVVLQFIDPRDGLPTSEYPYNPNGSIEAITGICDPTGRIFGLMPHPEAYWSPFNHPNWVRLKIDNKLPEEGQGIKIFRNAVNFVKETF